MFKRIRTRLAVGRALVQLDESKREMIKSLEDDLREKIDEAYRADLGGILLSETMERLKPERDFLHFLKQEQMREKLHYAGIKIPDEFGTSFNDDVLLTQKGEEWARIQLRKYREQRIEFWAKLVMPVLSLIVSIVALYFSTRLHK